MSRGVPVSALLALPALGCVYVDTTPEAASDVEVLDAKGERVPEAWALTWRDTRTCPLGFLCWYPFFSPTMWPDLRSTEDVRLKRLTRADSEVVRPASYEAYVLWGLLILPPGSYCRSWSQVRIFAAGCPWGFDGVEQTWRRRVLLRARDGPAEHATWAWLEPILDRLRDDPGVKKKELGDFARMLLANLETLHAGSAELRARLRGLAEAP